MSYILSLDQGTTSSRAILFDKESKIVGVGQHEFKQIFPQPGWVEHDALVIWETQLKSAEDALASASASWSDVAAIGITNQRETIVLWDKRSGKPVANAIVWQDRRTAEYCDQLKQDDRESWIQKKTGLLLDPYFSATKIKWLMEENPEAIELAKAAQLAIGTIDTWLIWNLSGGKAHITDVSNASRTLLMNLETLDWDQELLDLFQVPRSALADIVDSSGSLAESSSCVTTQPIPITGIAGDQQAALFGQVCFSSGMVKNTYGTGCFLLMNVGTEPVYSANKLLATVAWRIGGVTEYALEGSVFIGGALIQWLRDELRIIDSALEVESLAAEVKDSGGVTIIPAFSGLGAPYWDPHARGAIMGLTRGTSRAHIARAALEGIAFQVADVASAMEEDSGRKLETLQADGGASANGILMQTQADLLGVPVLCARIAETTALGAAYLAGLAVSYWGSKKELEEGWSESRRFEPASNSEDRKSKMLGWRKNVARVRG
ncbi:glycerol kinase GlpK [Candidatus Pelagisphaera phototrophica]|uniref:glycerol kinase GlpK n=1 Tax=Candidatus Pelagisphaera phototrophica TaxID=2684113 RepID=UPI001A08691B|nr:glycerol kinase GlpK [Candidatus Pelagisphaera phototrophica]QXD31478.1 glycerol kinase GlpK [Candidatus Pelagisphaera phototrophica]